MLCVAVMLSVMVLGAGAAFSDQDQIENTEAVDACSALNIIGGYEDGSFHPERNIKRSEITKMICVALNGGNEPNVSTNAVPTFSDVRGTSAEWAEGYIESCVAQGIVSGVGGGRFSPDGNVTGAQLAKMLLVSLGYNAENEKFVGDTWETNVNVRASQKGLYKGLENLDTSVAVTRDQAAQMVWNALQANMVEYKTTIVTDENGQLTTQVTVQDRVVASTSDKLTLLRDKYDGVVETGFITVAPSSKTNPKGITFVWDADGDGDYGDDVNNVTETVTFRNVTTDVSDLLGYEVTLVWNTNDINASDAIYGFYKTDNNTSYEATWADIEQDGAKVKFDGTSYELDGAIKVYADDAPVANWTSTAFNEDALADKVIFIDNDADGKFEAAQVKTQDVTQVTYVGSSNIDTKVLIADDRAAANQYDPFDPYETNPKLADVITYDGIAKDDYVKVSYDYYNDKVVYEKIDAVEATVEATRTTNAGTKEIRIDGTWYSPAKGYDIPSLVSGDSIEYIAIGTLLYNVKKVDGTWGSKSLAVVYDVAKYGVGSKANELEVSFITRDGVKKTALLDKYNNVAVEYITVADPDGATGYDIDKDDAIEWDTAVDAKNALVGHLVTYRESGNEVSLMNVTAAQPAGYDDIYDDIASFDNANGKLNSTANGSISIADTAVAFVWDDTGDADVLTGKAAKSAFKNAAPAGVDAVAAGGEENGVNYIQACTIKVNNVDGVNVVGSNYAYVISAGETNKVDDYREFVLWTDSGELVAYEKTSEFYDFDGGEIISYDVISTTDGMTVIDNVEIVEGLVGRVTSSGLYGTNNNKVAINNTEYDLDNDCVIVNVDTDAKEGIEGDAASAVRYGQEGKNNILYITNGSDDDIVFILVDSENEELKLVKTISGGTVSADSLAAAFNASNYVVLDADTKAQNAWNIPAGKTLTVNGNLDLDGDNLTVNGTLIVNGTYTLSGATEDGSGTVIVNGEIVFGSKLAGTVKVTANTARMANNMTISGGTVTIKGAITNADKYTLTITGGTVSATNVSANLTVSGGTVNVGAVTGDVTASGTANVTAGNVTGNVVASGTADVVTGTVSGNLTASDDTDVATGTVNGKTINTSTGTVTVDGERVEVTVEDILTAALAYQYDNYKYKGTTGISVDENGAVTVTYNGSHEDVTTPSVDAAQSTKITPATADLARFLGAIYRFDEGATVTTIGYKDTNYTWDSSIGLEGSNWANNKNTLVSAVATDCKATFFDNNSPKTGKVTGTFVFTINGENVTLNLVKAAQE